MRLGFVLRLALREGQSALRRIGVFGASIALGVGTLVAIHGLREDMKDSLGDEAQSLLGADVRFGANSEYAPSVVEFVDSLSASGTPTSSVTTVLSMVMATRNEAVRLLQVRGVTGDYPFYGNVRSTPADAWQRLQEPGSALVEPGVLTQLGVQIGDSLLIGESRFVIAGTVEGLPAELGLRTAGGPRVHISAQGLQQAGLLTFGSLARYETYVRMPDPNQRGDLRERWDDLEGRGQARFTTAEAEARDLTRAVDWLGRYLGLVGLAALLLGAVGVASAVHVFVKEKLSSVAVLRCLGARQTDVFSAYVLLTAGLGLLGSLAGAALGVVTVLLVPDLVSRLVPVQVVTTPRLGLTAAGVGIGLWVSVLFALAPLLTIRDVPPLLALRRDFEPPPRRWADPARAAVWVALVLTVLGLAAYEAPESDQGVGFAVGVALVALALWVAAKAVMWLTRVLFPRSAPYPIRQGVANLFRPRNQTVSVTLALGFGAFVLGTILQVQSSITESLRMESGNVPNLVLFDVQPDQTDGVLALIPDSLRAGVEVTPMVPARISRVASEAFRMGRNRWATRREYRNTFRDHLTDAETMVAGRWFDALPVRKEGEAARVSVEDDLAESLGVTLGDTIVWDVGGAEVASVVTSLRTVDWGRFSTNFFVVFEPGVLEDAPRMDVILAKVADADERLAIQRRLVRDYPNVSALDVQQIQETLGEILSKVTTGVRVLALACALAGTLVLAGALSTSRYQRTREAALLRTLGARRGQVTGVLLTEYAALGSVAALAGLVLAMGAASWIVVNTLELEYRPDLRVLGGVWSGITALTVATGFLMSLPVLRRPPLPVLREITE